MKEELDRNEVSALMMISDKQGNQLSYIYLSSMTGPNALIEIADYIMGSLDGSNDGYHIDIALLDFSHHQFWLDNDPDPNKCIKLGDYSYDNSRPFDITSLFISRRDRRCPTKP